MNQFCLNVLFTSRFTADVSKRTFDNFRYRLDNYCNIKVGGIEQFPVSSTQAPIRWMSLETLNTGNIQPRSIVVNLFVGLIALYIYIYIYVVQIE